MNRPEYVKISQLMTRPDEYFGDVRLHAAVAITAKFCHGRLVVMSTASSDVLTTAPPFHVFWRILSVNAAVFVFAAQVDRLSFTG